MMRKPSIEGLEARICAIRLEADSSKPPYVKVGAENQSTFSCERIAASLRQHCTSVGGALGNGIELLQFVHSCIAGCLKRMDEMRVLYGKLPQHKFKSL